MNPSASSFVPPVGRHSIVTPKQEEDEEGDSDRQQDSVPSVVLQHLRHAHLFPFTGKRGLPPLLLTHRVEQGLPLGPCHAGTDDRIRGGVHHWRPLVWSARGLRLVLQTEDVTQLVDCHKGHVPMDDARKEGEEAARGEKEEEEEQTPRCNGMLVEGDPDEEGEDRRCEEHDEDGCHSDVERGLCGPSVHGADRVRSSPQVCGPKGDVEGVRLQDGVIDQCQGGQGGRGLEVDGSLLRLPSVLFWTSHQKGDVRMGVPRLRSQDRGRLDHLVGGGREKESVPGREGQEARKEAKSKRVHHNEEERVITSLCVLV